MNRPFRNMNNMLQNGNDMCHPRVTRDTLQKVGAHPVFIGIVSPVSPKSTKKLYKENCKKIQMPEC